MADGSVCAAGRTAFFGGRWSEPCSARAIQHIGSPAAEPIHLCDEHFNQVNEAGLVADPNIGSDEYERREQTRKGEAPSQKRKWFRRR